MRPWLNLGLVVTSALVAGAASVSTSDHATYPGAGISTDPTGCWAIEWKEATKQTAHRLFLRDLKTGRATQLYEFDRSVDLLWAPGSKTLAITDHTGSNESLIFLIHPEQPRSPIDVEQAFIRSLGRIRGLYENGHRYFEAQKWLSSSELQFGVHAYDAQPDVEYKAVFVFDSRDGNVRQAVTP